MRAAQVACWLAVVGLLVVPIGCANEGTATAVVPSTTDHSTHHASTTVAAAPTTTAVVAPARLDIVATEYQWSGLPDELPAGTYPMSFTNHGTEAHEISIFRNTDRIALEELAAMGPVKFKDFVEEVGMLIAGAGTSAPAETTITLTPGEYDVVCFIPAADMQPHFAHGMHRKLVVR